MDSTENKSKAKLLIVVGIVVVFAIIAGAVYALVRTNEAPKQTNTQQNQQNASDQPARNVTQQVLQQDLTDLDSSIKKTQQSHESAKKAVDDPAKRIKVSE